MGEMIAGVFFLAAVLLIAVEIMDKHVGEKENE